MKKTTILPLIIGVFILSSCVVSKKKYETAEAGRWAALYSRDSLADLLDGSKKQCDMLMQDTTLLGNNLRNYQALLTNNMNENEKLNASLAQKIGELGEREKTILQLQNMINEQNYEDDFAQPSFRQNCLSTHRRRYVCAGKGTACNLGFVIKKL